MIFEIIYLYYYLLNDIDFCVNRKKLIAVRKAGGNFNISINILTIMLVVCIQSLIHNSSYLQYLYENFTLSLFENMMYVLGGGTSVCKIFFGMYISYKLKCTLLCGGDDRIESKLIQVRNILVVANLNLRVTVFLIIMILP